MIKATFSQKKEVQCISFFILHGPQPYVWMLFLILPRACNFEIITFLKKGQNNSLPTLSQKVPQVRSLKCFCSLRASHD